VNVQAPITPTLAAFAAGLTFDALPSDVRVRVKQILLDTIASALAGHDASESPRVLDAARQIAPGSSATVIGAARMSEAGATLANGHLITAVTVCDIHRPTTCHTTPEVVPPALAVAETQHARGQDLLVAVAAGLETTTRVGLGLGPAGFRARGWHAPGVTGPFGGAVAAGRLLGLGTDEMTHALGFAGSQAAGTYAQLGTAAIKLQQARGALGGLLSARWALNGLTAADDILGHPDGGLFSAYSDAPRPEATLDGLGEDWELMRISLRPFPVAVHLQPVVTGLLDLLGRGVAPSDIQRITVETSPTAFRMHGTNPWQDRFRARLSTPYVTAVVLLDGTCWLDQFTVERVAADDVNRFIEERVTVAANADLPDGTTTIRVQHANGSHTEVDVDTARGEPTRPLAQPETEAKLRAANEQFGTASATAPLIAAINDLESVDDMAELMRLLRMEDT
jgi:2-methylcitrate dehydratase PrpD